MKKIISLALMLILALGIFTGCKIVRVDEEENEVNKNEVENGQKVQESTLGNFAKYGDDIYYWKLTEKSRSASALYLQLSVESDYIGTLIRRGKDGKEHIVAQDAGYGELYVTKDKIYYQVLRNNVSKICSIDHNGSNKKEYIDGLLKYAYGDYLYIQSDSDIIVLNVAQDGTTKVVSDATILGIADEYVYYYKSKENQLGNVYEIQFGNIKGSSDYGINQVVASDEIEDEVVPSLEDLSVTGFEYKKNTVCIKVGSIQGTAHIIYDEYTILMDADGSNATRSRVEAQEEGSESYITNNNGILEYNNKELLYLDPNSDNKVAILTDNELYTKYSMIGYTSNNEYEITIYSADRIGSDIYFVLDNGMHNEEEDIGWRYSYMRTRTVAIKYNVDSKEFETIYTF